jgi:hypothetical protein
MFMKLLPIQVKGTGSSGELVVEIKSDEDLEAELKRRGLPLSVFGCDVPKSSIRGGMFYPKGLPPV